MVREWTPDGAAFDGAPGVDAMGQVRPYDTGDASGYDRVYRYDLAGRLSTVNDRTAAATGTVFDPADPTQGADTGCTVRTYAYTGNPGLNGARTGRTSTDYGPDCATGAGTATTASYGYDSADRPTTAGNGAGEYSYDELGRQTTIPAADTPNGGGDLTLAYYDTDLPQAITQGATTTSYTLNTDGHRTIAATGPPGGAPTNTTTRHYSDTSDNPAWTDTTTGGGTPTTSRYTPSLGGDLGASIGTDGAATLALNNLHGDTVTTITIPAAQDGTTNATCIDSWSDYTEFGTPRDPKATLAVAGPAGYGWLGAKQRSTTPESAGLTLMGDRLYNPVTGRFTSPDPEPGGNTTAYTYPQDPINGYDLDGHCWSHFGWACSPARWVHKEVVNVIAVVPYAAYLGAYTVRHRSFARNAPLTMRNRMLSGVLLRVERRGLAADVGIDRYKMRHRLGESSSADEGPGSVVYLNPLHGISKKLHVWQGPRIKNAPGVWEDKIGRRRYDW